MAAPHTPELEKSKLAKSPSMLSPHSSPLSTKFAAEQGQAQTMAGLPPTPKSTPATDAVTDSFEDENDAEDERATKNTIESLAPGQNPTADFVPNWQTTEDGSRTNVAPAPTGGGFGSTSTPSTPELHARHSHVQLSFSPVEVAVPQGECPRLGHATPQSLESRKRRASQLEPISRTSDPPPYSPDRQSATHQTQAASVTLSSSPRKAGLVAYHIGKAKTDKAYQRFRRSDSSSPNDGPETVKRITGSTLHAWFEKPNTPKGRQEHWRELRDTEAKYARLHKSVAGAFEQAESSSKSKPTPRPKAVKARKRPAPLHTWPDEAGPRRSDFSRRDALPDHFRFTTHEPLSGSESESENASASDFSDHLPIEKTKVTGVKARRAAEEQDQVVDGLAPAKTKTTGAKRKRPVDEQGRSSNSAVLKKRKTGTRGIGEGKVKSKKDRRLGDIKHWLDSKTKKYVPGKKPGDPPTPLHKSDYEALDFVRLPKWGSKIDRVEIQKDEKLAPKGDYRGGDPTRLHPKELELARENNLSYDDYRCQKRRIFAARAVFDQICAEEKLAPSWGRTQTQLVGSIDANKSSLLFANFDSWGWFETMKEEWDQEYLSKLVADFIAHDPKQPWSLPAKDRQLAKS